MFGRIRLACMASGTLAFVCLGGGAAGAANPNLIKNSSFESPIAKGGSFGDYLPFSKGAAFGGWVVTGSLSSDDILLIYKTYTYVPYIFSPKAGNQWLDLTGTKNGKSGVTQTVKVAKNRNYVLSFYVGTMHDDPGRIGGVSSKVLVYIDSKLAMTAINSTATGKTLSWKKFSKVIRSGTTGSMKVEFRNGDPSYDGVNGLDAVSLVLAAPVAPDSFAQPSLPNLTRPDLDSDGINLVPQ